MKILSFAEFLSGTIVLHQIFVIALLLIRTESRKDHSWAMVVFFTVNLLGEWPTILGYFLPEWRFERGEGTFLAFATLLGPSLYFYCKALVSPNLLRFDARMLRHAYPVFLSFFMGTIAALTKDYVVEADQLTKENLTAGLITNVLAQIVIIAVLVFSFNFYFAKIIRVLLKYRKRRFDYLSDMDGVSLSWVEWMIWLLSTVWVGIIAVFVYNIMNPGNYFAEKMIIILEAIWVYALTFMVLWQQQIFRPARLVTMADPALADEAGKPTPLALDEKEEGKRYQRSSLDDARIQRITAKVERAMTQDHLYRNQGITLRHLSDHTRVSENHLSEVLNSHMGRNFYEFINHWRVRDACALLAQLDVPIIAIGEEVGFNSRSTFNAAFKKETGLTPSEYRSSLPLR